MDPKTRFSDRVNSYIKGRPGYPAELLPLLREQCGLNPNSVVADIGSGTGILSRILSEVAHTVYGIEPNQAMREAGQDYLATRQNFISVAGSAESTGLAATTVDLITAAQSFHWFDQKEARHEFMRILKPNGFTALIWNDRKTEGSPFAEAYESLLATYGTDYHEVKRRNETISQDIERFFGHSQYKKASFPNAQNMDLKGLIERVLSASYMPGIGHSRYEGLLREMENVFAKHEQEGAVVLEYETNVYFGPMS